MGLIDITKQIEALKSKAATAQKELDDAAKEEASLFELTSMQETIAAANCAKYWRIRSELAAGRGERLDRIAVGRGETYGEIFFRHASEEEIKKRPDDDEGIRKWAIQFVVWYPPAGDGALDPVKIRAYIDGHMALYPGTWAKYVGALMAHSVETAELVRGKA